LFDWIGFSFDLTVASARAMNVMPQGGRTVQIETKFLSLRTPVTVGSRFGDWQVTWLGGWTRGRLSYLVMAVKMPRPAASVPVKPQTSRPIERPSKKRLKVSAQGT
jgi:hypothetical protein